MQKKPIYADNAATTKLNSAAFEAMVPWMIEAFGNASQSYSFARAPKKALSEAREVIAGCINALPEEIYFTAGGTEGDNWAIKGISFCNYEKRKIITSVIEHHALLKACESIAKLGYPVEYLSVTPDGAVCPKSLENIITDRTILVSVMMINNETGVIQPVEKLAEIAHKHGAYFHTDAVQAVGHLPIDVKRQEIDMLTASAHKFNGPKGIGFMYVKKGVKISSYMDGGAQERSMRAGTENVAAIVGMAIALKSACNTIESEITRLVKLRCILVDKLNGAGIDFIVNGDKNTYPGTISLSFKNLSGEMLLHRLDLQGIYISTGSACDSVATRISHVIAAMSIPDSYAKGTVRISFGKDNTEEEAAKIAEELIKIIKK